jgi:hypothetical protein
MDSQQNVPPLSLPSIEETVPSSIDGSFLPTQTAIANQPISTVDTKANVLNDTKGKSEENLNPSAELITAPTIADDVDLIEKEWIKKISEIMAKTKDSPYERAMQLAVLKQEYLQKRYSKTIKLA